MNINKAALALIALAIPSFALAANDRALFEQHAHASAQRHVIAAGEAPIDRAIELIVPAPYRVLLDDAIPAELVLAWNGGDSWSEVLNEALWRVGLTMMPDWTNNTVTVTLAKQPGGTVARMVHEKAPQVSHAPDASPAPSVPNEAWTLEAGRPVHAQLQDWAKRAGWVLEWGYESSWVVPAATTYTQSFEKAVESVIQELYAQGKPIRLKIWGGNRVMEVLSNDVN